MPCGCDTSELDNCSHTYKVGKIDWGPEFWIEITYRDENNYRKVKDYFHTNHVVIHLYVGKDKTEKTLIITGDSIKEKWRYD